MGLWGSKSESYHLTLLVKRPVDEYVYTHNFQENTH